MLREIPQMFIHALVYLGWSGFDFSLTIWNKIRKFNYIGRYVYIMTKSEQIMIFDDDDEIYAYSGYNIIKIGSTTDTPNFDTIIDVINHEVLHQVLENHINHYASLALDFVHKGRFNKRFQRYIIDFQ